MLGAYTPPGSPSQTSAISRLNDPRLNKVRKSPMLWLLCSLRTGLLFQLTLTLVPFPLPFSPTPSFFPSAPPNPSSFHQMNNSAATMPVASSALADFDYDDDEEKRIASQWERRRQEELQAQTTAGAGTTPANPALTAKKSSVDPVAAGVASLFGSLLGSDADANSRAVSSADAADPTRLTADNNSAAASTRFPASLQAGNEKRVGGKTCVCFRKISAHGLRPIVTITGKGKKEARYQNPYPSCLVYSLRGAKILLVQIWGGSFHRQISRS